MFSRISVVALAGLACASCATSDGLQTLTRTTDQTSRGRVIKNTTRITSGILAGNLMVSNFYYWNRPQPVTAPILRDMDIRARRAGCLDGNAPTRSSVSARWGTYTSAYRIIGHYDCD
ncbi:hypothetical protein J8I29_00905 [Labrys sp. LIt4]|uniref:hypothetical protein n=1 Tax=Labrys TaxID=204476 RepID=UPI0011B1DE3D|nr:MULTISPECIES: hypothetical protein [Labrys]MBP0577856.1 hypothetical protein [Labrys sp. LIt4]